MNKETLRIGNDLLDKIDLIEYNINNWKGATNLYSVNLLIDNVPTISSIPSELFTEIKNLTIKYLENELNKYKKDFENLQII